MPLTAELHCHTVYSNSFNKSRRIPFESTVTPEALLQQCLLRGVDCVCVTEHNNLRGYHRVRELKDSRPKFRHILVLPGIEVSTRDGHIIALGVKEHIKTGMSVEETLDAIDKQHGVAVAVHPFALQNGIREKARLCRCIEVHNAVNVDIFSNIASRNYARAAGKVEVVGSDAHIPELIGRCTNEIFAEPTEDDVVEALMRSRVRPKTAGYITPRELHAWVYSKLYHSREKVLRYLGRERPRWFTLGSVALAAYIRFPGFPLWRGLIHWGIRGAKRRSRRVNSAWLRLPRV